MEFFRNISQNKYQYQPTETKFGTLDNPMALFIMKGKKKINTTYFALPTLIFTSLVHIPLHCELDCFQRLATPLQRAQLNHAQNDLDALPKLNW
jgi:hypothetical protein